jgi:MarR family 2-MHQ and catechol resistance regulon transcriptional repressor
MNSQVAGYLPLTFACPRYLLALERDCRVLLDVQEIRALQMRVPLLVEGVDLARVNSNVNAVFGGIIGIVLDRPLNTAKAAANVRDHHMADNELRARVRWIDFVSCFQCVSFSDGTVCQNYLDIKIDVAAMKKIHAGEAESDPKTNASATHVWLVLSKAARAVEQNATNSVSGLGLGLTDFAILEVLLHKGAQPVNAIGKKILLTSGSITTAIDRLESRKLVARTPHPEDQRARLVQLTAQGKGLIEDAFRQHALDMEKTMAVLTPNERIELTRLLKKVGIFAAARLNEGT